MNKEQVLNHLKSLIESGQIAKSEVLSLFSEESSVKKTSVNIINILYGIGGIVILAGIISLIAQNWTDFPSFARILVTLGMAVVLYISATLLTVRDFGVLSQILLSLSFILFPVGIGVFISELNINLQLGGTTFILLLLTALAWLTYYLLRKSVTGTLFAVIFGTLTVYAFVAFILDNSGLINSNIYLYLTMVLGISHGLIGYYLQRINRVHQRLGQLLYSTGTLGVLVGAISLGGIWDVLFVFVVVAAFFLSVYVHSRGMLVLSSLFLVGYIFKITAEYFAGSIGWPIALILIGILTIAIAIVTFKVNQKYFKNAELRSSEN